MPKQIIIQSSIEAFEVIDTPIPVPKDNEIVIKVVVAGSNQKDWKHPQWSDTNQNSGDDMAGIVHSVGKDVTEFQLCDRVVAMHQFMTDHGNYGEYAVAQEHMTFHLANRVSFEEGATLPTAGITAALALFEDIKLPAPYEKSRIEAAAGKKTPILIYGVTTAVGAFAAKLARLSGLHPIIGVAGKAQEFARSLADYVVDYRKGEHSVVDQVKQILADEALGATITHVFDAVSEGESLDATLRLINPNGGIVATVLPPKMFAKAGKDYQYPKGVTGINTACPRVFAQHKDFGYVWSRCFGRLLANGRMSAHPYEVIPAGLHGVLTGLKMLKDGKASGLKYVYKIDDTGDLELGMHGSSGNNEGGQGPKRMKEFPAFDMK